MNAGLREEKERRDERNVRQREENEKVKFLISC